MKKNVWFALILLLVCTLVLSACHKDLMPDEPATDRTFSSTETVWIPTSGEKYHTSPTCSNMKNPKKVTRGQAKKQGYDPCQKCYGSVAE